MKWSEVTAHPGNRLLRQFAGLCLGIFGGLAAYRAFRGQTDLTTAVLAGLALIVGVTGLIRPSAIRLIYTGWMVAVFPIGWTVSHLLLAVTFYGVFTPIAAIFRAFGRDTLALRRSSTASYWTKKPSVSESSDYLKQF
jgi:hypothetical protein